MTEKVANERPFFEEELPDLEWQAQAPYIEPTSYLVESNGSGSLAAVGKEVVFIKEGFFDQCKALQHAQVDPRWSSFGLRRWQASCLSQSGRDMQRDGIGYCKLGMVEWCRVIGISYHRREVPQVDLEHVSSGRATDGVWEAPAASISEQQAGNQQPPSSSRRDDNEPQSSSDSESSEEVEEGPLGRYFVRVRLQRLPTMNDQLGPVSTTVDHYLDAGVGEWIIPRERYEATMSKQWKRGDRIQMYWADQASSGRGQWWEGTVVGYVKRSPADPFLGSPWAAVTVKWSETESKDNISPWELSIAEDQFRLSDDESNLESVWDAAQECQSSEDEDWEAAEMQRKGSSRRRSSSRRVSPCSTDSDESFNFTHKRKKHRTDSGSQIPETMLPRKSKGTVDWNKGHCAVCMSRPDGSLVLECDGTCLRSFHNRCLPAEQQPGEDEAADAPWFCQDCREGLATCAACKFKGTAGTELLKCRLGGCGNYFHPSCLRALAAQNVCAKIHRDSGEASSSSGRVHLMFTCPSHYCDRCHLSGDSLKIYRCWTCLKAFHGKCMEREEVRLNEREMECKDCATKSQPAKAPNPAPGRVAVDTAVEVWQPGSGLAETLQVGKWIASITDLGIQKKVDLVGKTIFHFGSHKKGGGCDFLVPVPNVKFHSALKVQADGNVEISYCYHKAKELAEVTITHTGERSHVLTLRPKMLRDGDIVRIANAVFIFQLRQWEPLHCPLLLI